jgi:hypothetical protein
MWRLMQNWRVAGQHRSRRCIPKRVSGKNQQKTKKKNFFSEKRTKTRFCQSSLIKPFLTTDKYLDRACQALQNLEIKSADVLKKISFSCLGPFKS